MPNDQKFRAGKSSDFFPLPLMKAEHGPADAPHMDKEEWARASGLPATHLEFYRTVEEREEGPEAPDIPADADRSRDVTKPVGPERKSPWESPTYKRIYNRSYSCFRSVFRIIDLRDESIPCMFLLAWNHAFATEEEFRRADTESRGQIPNVIKKALDAGKKPGDSLGYPKKLREALAAFVERSDWCEVLGKMTAEKRTRILNALNHAPGAEEESLPAARYALWEKDRSDKPAMPPANVEPTEAAPAAPPSSHAPEEVVLLKDEPADERPSDPPGNPLRREENPPTAKDTARIIGIQFDCFLKRYGIDAALTLIENLAKRI